MGVSHALSKIGMNDTYGRWSTHVTHPIDTQLTAHRACAHTKTEPAAGVVRYLITWLAKFYGQPTLTAGPTLEN